MSVSRSVPRVSRRKNSIWNLVFSYSTIAYSIVSGLVLVPIYLRYIPADLYGAWLASGNILAWLLVVDPGLSSVILQRVGHSYGASEMAALGQYAIGGLAITGLLILGVFAAGFLLSEQVPGWVNLNDIDSAQELVLNFKIAVGASCLMLLAYAVGVVNMGLQGGFAHGMVFLCSNLCTLFVTILLLFNGYGLLAISLGLVARGAVFFLGGLGYFIFRVMKESIPLNLNPTRIRELFGLLSYTSLGKIGGILSRNVDAFFIARFLGPDLVTVYVLTRRTHSVAETFLNRTGNAIGPSLSHLAGEGDTEKMRSILQRLFSLNLWMLGFAGAGFFAFNDDFLRLWVGNEFFAGLGISRLMTALMVATVIFTLLQTLCVALGDIKRNAVVQFIQALVSFPLLVAGVYYLGLLGAVLAPLAAFLAVSAWYYPRSITRHGALDRSTWAHLGWQSGVALAAGMVLALGFSALRADTWLIFFGGILVLGMAYGAILMVASPPFREEARGALHWAQRRMRLQLAG